MTTTTSTEFEQLTINHLPTLVGKTIEWKAPAYSGNAPYTGISTIESVNPQESRPIKSATIEGDNLNYAFIDGDLLSYSDSSRYVTFRIITK